MISLSKTRSIKRFLLLALGMASLLGGLFMAGKLIKTPRVDAANDLGQVTIESPDDTWIMYWSDQDEGAYGSGNLWYIGHTVNLSTPRIGVMTADNTKVAYDAYCVDPTKTAPDGSGYNVVAMPTSRPYNKIKLAVLLSSIYRNINGKFKDQQLINKVNTIVDGWLENADRGPNTKWNNDEGRYLEYGEIKFEGTFPDINTNAGKKDYIYLMTHLTISYMLHGDINDLYTDYMDNDDSRDQADWAVLDAIKTSVDELISNNDDLWIMAQNYVLYGITDQPDGVQDVVWIEDGDPASGSLEVQKCDKETSICSPQGNASFQGISFTVANNSGGRIYAEGITNPKDNTNFFDNGDIMATGTTGSDGTYTFSGLPLGVQYKVTETSTNSSYLMPATADASQNVTINNETTPEVLKFYDDVVRGDFKFIKVDENNNSSPMSNVVFRITNSKGTESHIIVSDLNGEVSTSKVDHNKNTNGYDQYVDDDGKVSPGIAYNSNTGIWFGSDTPDNSRGALPYDTYTITELECDANKYCYDVASSTQTVVINSDNTVIDLGEWDNDCAEFNITTSATDTADGDKFIEASSTADITDTINYCGKAGLTYTIQGVLMDKETNQPIMAQTITDTLTDDCGTATMTFSLDASELAGKDIVVFETLLYNNEIVAEHKDINDASQTVTVVNISTTATDTTDGDKFIEASATASITDTISYCGKAGLTYTVQGVLMDKATGQPVTIEGEPIQEEKSFTPTSKCGTIDMEFSLDASELAGKDIVVFETLLYNNEIVAEHKDIDDASQTVTVISLSTTAVDGADGDKLVEASTNSQIIDSIDYCLRSDLEYTIKGILMDKETDEPLDIDGKTIEETVSFTPTDGNCGTAQMTFTLDSTKLAGKAIVVYESVEYDGETILTHQDIEDVAQTVNIISLDTYALDRTDKDKEVIASKEATVTDHIKYCLVANTNYTIVGTLMNKATGKAIMVDDAPVWSTTTITPIENCGDLYLDFDFDATGLGGTEIVVYEAAGITSPTPLSDSDICLEHDTKDPNACTSYFHTLITHANLDDVAQTVLVTDPPETPETGALAKSNSNSNNSTDFFVLPITLTVISAISYPVFRLISRKKLRLFRH